MCQIYRYRDGSLNNLFRLKHVYFAAAAENDHLAPFLAFVNLDVEIP
jgi:hypothetical protein